MWSYNKYYISKIQLFTPNVVKWSELERFLMKININFAI